MQVELIQSATFNLDTEHTSQVPMETFLKMLGIKENQNEAPQTLPKLQMFKTIDSFKEEYEKNGAKFAPDTTVQILASGQVCCFLRPFSAEGDNNRTDNNKTQADATTDSKTHKAE